MLSSKPSAALEDLLSELASGDDQRAEAAARRFAALGEAGLNALRRLLASPQADLRWWAVRALAEFPSEQASQGLIQALQDAEISVRQCAAQGLCQRPTPEAVPALIAAMASGDSLLTRLAANALINLGGEAVPALMDLLRSGGDRVRAEAARALALIGDERAIPALYQASGEGSALLDYWVDEGLERMGAGMLYFKP
jgi:HEAT repeat protein